VSPLRAGSSRCARVPGLPIYGGDGYVAAPADADRGFEPAPRGGADDGQPVRRAPPVHVPAGEIDCAVPADIEGAGGAPLAAVDAERRDASRRPGPLRISFSCLSRRTRLRSSRSSSRSRLLTPSSRSRRSTWSCLSQFRRHDSAIPNSFAIGRFALAGEFDRSLTELLRIRPRHEHILPEAPDGTSDQVSTKAGEDQSVPKCR